MRKKFEILTFTFLEATVPVTLWSEVGSVPVIADAWIMKFSDQLLSLIRGVVINND